MEDSYLAHSSPHSTDSGTMAPGLHAKQADTSTQIQGLYKYVLTPLIYKPNTFLIWHLTSHKIVYINVFPNIYCVENLHIEKYMRIKCGLGWKWAIKQISEVGPVHIMKAHKGVEI